MGGDVVDVVDEVVVDVVVDVVELVGGDVVDVVEVVGVVVVEVVEVVDVVVGGVVTPASVATSPAENARRWNTTSSIVPRNCSSAVFAAAVFWLPPMINAVVAAGTTPVAGLVAT